MARTFYPGESSHLIESKAPSGSIGQGKARRSMGVLIGISVLCGIAAWFYLWPLYRAFLPIEISGNEGWNAYFADAAMGRMPLYPSAEQLITNNYPPLSFFAVGGLGRLLGDVVLAGRLLSLAAVLGIAGAVALAIRWLGGDRAGATVGAAFFVATINLAAPGYVGMNDPQLLAQSIMAIGFAGFLKAMARNRGYLAPVLLMAVAGFFKHNIIAMPLTSVIWLGIHRPRQAASTFSIALAAIALGFVVCHHFFGPDFFMNMLTPRGYSWEHFFKAVTTLALLSLGLATFFFFAWMKRRDSNVRLLCLLAGIALVAFLLQVSSPGVDINAQFDLIIALSMGVGFAFTQIPALPALRLKATGGQIALLVLICSQFMLAPLSSKRFCPTRLLFDGDFQKEIAKREDAMKRNIAHVRAVRGDVLCSRLVCYWSGKPYIVDEFNVWERIRKGALPPDAVSKRLESGTLTFVETEPARIKYR